MILIPQHQQLIMQFNPAEQQFNPADLILENFDLTLQGNPHLQFDSTVISLGKYDVICGRGRIAFNHTGNKRFREIVQSNLKKYSDASTKSEKSIIVSLIMRLVRLQGNFVKYTREKGRFENVHERLAREKVGQVLRDILHTQYRSSTEAKKKRRLAQKQQRDAQIKQIVTNNKRINSIINVASTKVSDLTSDADCKRLFLAANLNILRELKESKCVDMLQAENEESSPSLCLPATLESSNLNIFKE